MFFLRRFIRAHERALWAALVCIWASGIVGGMVLLAWHDASPGGFATVPPRWPSGSQLARIDQRATLVMFAHPHCPCTRASLGEFERLVARRPGLVDCWVIFFRPAEMSSDWETSDLVATAMAIPGVQVLFDLNGSEARRFNVLTSGHTLLYGADGALSFSGGITFARGHAGDNAGRSSLESLLVQSTPLARQTPVFGCPIVVPGQE